MHPDDIDLTWRAFETAIQQRRGFTLEHRVRRHDGEFRHFRVRVEPVLETDGTVREWVGVHTDVTEQRLNEAEMLQVGPGIGVSVECVIDSGAVGVMKPDPRIFRLALDAMAISAADAWYVGDMPGIDVVGARAAGLHPVLMDPYQFHLDADYARVSSLTELATMLRATSETAAH